ncbi:MAG: hypothetical protein Q7S08_01270 [bacterium]|nr:hypothetical protein [bacterium]
MNIHLMRLVWFSIIAIAISFVISLVLGKIQYAESKGRSIVVIRDLISPGLHDLSGMIEVPKVCDEISVKAEQINPASYYLDFRTWEVPYRDCDEEGIPRVFHTTVIAPGAGVEFRAGLNGKPFSVIVLSEIKKK